MEHAATILNSGVPLTISYVHSLGVFYEYSISFLWFYCMRCVLGAIKKPNYIV